MLKPVFKPRFGAMALLTVLAACGQGQQQTGAPPPPTVTVAKPVIQSVVDHDDYVAASSPLIPVEVRARVSGYLEQVTSSTVRRSNKVDLLFTIESGSCRTRLNQAKGALAQARPTWLSRG